MSGSEIGEQPNIQECKQNETSSKFEVCYSKESGFYIIATKDFEAGEIIFKESPLSLAPVKPISEKYLPCVGCCRIVPLQDIFHCPECYWPCCSPDCKGLISESKHSLECNILKSKYFKESKEFRFDFILPLRIFLLQNQTKSKWSTLLKQQEINSNDKFPNKEIFDFLEENFLLPFRTQFEENENYLRLFTFIRTFKIKEENKMMELFYPIFSLVENSCIANTFYRIDNSDHYQLIIKTNSPIAKNTHITISHSSLFQGTHERQKDLKSSNFSCCCNRCKDPTEFGTFFSALKCIGTKEEPCDGTQLPLDPLDEDTLWVCDKCKIELPNDQLIKFIRHLGHEVDKVLKKKVTIDELEEFLAKLLMFLHPNHFYVCAIKRTLVKSYSEDLVSTKIDLSKSLIEIAQKLYPNGGLDLEELFLELFEAKFLLLRQSDKKTEDIGELKIILNSLKSKVLYNPEIVNDTESKFNEWLDQNFISY